MVSYQVEYVLQDEVGGYTIVVLFYTVMVKIIKGNKFWLFLPVVCVVNYLSRQLKYKKKMENNF